MSYWCEFLKKKILLDDMQDPFDVGYAYGEVGFASTAALITADEAQYLRKLISER